MGSWKMEEGLVADWHLLRELGDLQGLVTFKQCQLANSQVGEAGRGHSRAERGRLKDSGEEPQGQVSLGCLEMVGGRTEARRGLRD